MSAFNKLLIVDGSYLLHRQLNQKELSALVDKNKEPTGGVFGFLRSLNLEIHECGNYFPVVVFDHGLSSRRVKIDINYKKSTEKDMSTKIIASNNSFYDYVRNYRRQRSLLAGLLPNFGIPVLMFDGWEGDDLIALLSRISESCLILTDDNDMLQLLTETCQIKQPMGKKLWTLSEFLNEKHYSDVFDFVLYKAIKGDKSDNIPSSCKGVGDKYINDLIKLIRAFLIDRSKNKWKNFSDIIKDSDKVQVLCTEFGLHYRKAYCNFDYERFIKNVELVDLSLVKDYDNIIRSMTATIFDCNSRVSFFDIMSELKDMGITDIPVESLLSAVLIRHRNLK